MLVLTFIIGFLLTDGTLGTQLINGFYFIFIYEIIISIIAIAFLVFASISILKEGVGKLISAVIGGVSILLIAYLFVNLFLTYFIYTHINSAATSISDIGSQAQVGIVIFIIVLILNKISSLKDKDSSSKLDKLLSTKK